MVRRPSQMRMREWYHPRKLNAQERARFFMLRHFLVVAISYLAMATLMKFLVVCFVLFPCKFASVS